MIEFNPNSCKNNVGLLLLDDALDRKILVANMVTKLLVVILFTFEF